MNCTGVTETNAFEVKISQSLVSKVHSVFPEQKVYTFTGFV